MFPFSSRLPGPARALSAFTGRYHARDGKNDSAWARTSNLLLQKEPTHQMSYALFFVRNETHFFILSVYMVTSKTDFNTLKFQQTKTVNRDY
jgi:hypothetical protein